MFFFQTRLLLTSKLSPTSVPGKASLRYGTHIPHMLAYDCGSATWSLEKPITSILCVTRSTSDTHVLSQHQVVKPGWADGALIRQRLCFGLSDARFTLHIGLSQLKIRFSVADWFLR